MSNFAKLKAEWYRKLSNSGFNDIENADGTLKVTTDPRTITNAIRDNRIEYYREAKELLNSDIIITALERSIWEAHCEGTSFRDIAKKEKLTFYRVRTIVNLLQKYAGLRK